MMHRLAVITSIVALVFSVMPMAPGIASAHTGHHHSANMMDTDEHCAGQSCQQDSEQTCCAAVMGHCSGLDGVGTLQIENAGFSLREKLVQSVIGFLGGIDAELEPPPPRYRTQTS